MVATPQFSNLSQLVDVSLYKKMWPTFQIILFYALVMMVTSTLGFVLFKKDGAVHGLALGAVLSLYLWYQYGKDMSYL
jgi:hypothetical protein